MPYYMHELNPDYNPATGMLHHMTTDELKKLLNDDDRLESMIKDLQQVKNLEAEREMLIASNKSLAEYNLSQEPVLEKLKVQLQRQFDELKSYKRRVESKKKSMDELTKSMSLDTTLALLQTAAAEAEEESEAISESFLSSEIGVDSFLETYLSKRKLAHLRRVKVEKMVELLNSQASKTLNFSASSEGAFSSNSNLPYPMSGGGVYPPSYPGLPFQG